MRRTEATASAPIGTCLLAFLMSFVLVLGLCPAIALAEGESDPTLLYYLKGTDWNIGTTDDWHLNPQGEVGVREGYYLTNTTPIVAADELEIYVRPGTALRFKQGPMWHEASNGYGWSKETAEAGSLRVDPDNDNVFEWEFSLSEPVSDEGKYVVLIEDTGAYEEFSISMSAYLDGPRITMNVHVVPYNETNKLSDVLAAQHEQNDEFDNLSIKTLPVTLYNYEGGTFNNAYRADGYLFVQDSAGPAKENASGYNSGSPAVKMGILEEQLSPEGLPVLREKWDVSGSVDVMEALFSTSAAEGKTVYDDVNFQFVYDSETQYYTYSSMLNHAQFNSANNTVELYRQSMGVQEANTATIPENTRGGFYPFTNINEAFVNSDASKIESNTSLSAWEETLKHAYSEETDYTAQLVKDFCYTDKASSTIDMHFGMQLEAYFYLPENKTSGGASGSSGEPLVFEFTGDDDMWVFIDGKLVLDVGGPHAARTGKINFQTGEVTVDLVSELQDPNSVDNKDGYAYSKDSETLMNLATDEIHKMQIFYLERFSGVSNCYMRFNIPIIPENSVSVTKSVADTDVNPTSVSLPTTFEFMLEVDEPFNGVEDPAPYIYEGAYTVSDVQYQTENKIFKLSEGETAVFEGIPSKSRVKVIEKGPEGNFHYVGMKITEEATETKWEYSDEPGTGEITNELSTEYVTTDKEGTQIDIFNIIEVAPLSIEKTFATPRPDEDYLSENFEMVLKFYSDAFDKTTPFSGVATKYAADGETKETIEIKDGAFSLKPGEKLVVEKVPVNMKGTVQEVGAEGQDFSTLYADPVIEGCGIQSGAVPFGNDSADFTVSKSADENVVTVNNSYAIGDLTIIKEGLKEPVSEDTQPEATYGNGGSKTPAAGESALFLVESKDGDFSKELVVAGNGSATIKNLMIGTYRVTELTDWTWGATLVGVYNDSDGNPIELNAIEGTTYEIEVTPSGAIIRFVNDGDGTWLHDDCWCKNAFGRAASGDAPSAN